eukprot:TRINITY_DN2753_c0_g1_i1.p1 TRINITY_DN2753_c0_g1~~TRINITY_DN2753_c0_g1_i1.p1  ORF type:complete len:615 (+),score=88.76 TRINITY_DN2753_c0_g1_i1:74-1918(+)
MVLAATVLVAVVLSVNIPAYAVRNLRAAGTVSRVETHDHVDFDHLRSSAVRFQVVSSEFDWLHPFLKGQDGVGLGSGFVVQVEPYPLFATNAHVIRDASQVALQLLLYGKQLWAAEVVSVCPKFDIAFVVLQKPEAFMAVLRAQNISLQALNLTTRVPRMGEDVVALGFPLGQDSLKISKGNIAGNEEVNGNICIQSTAPISPGSSGGPLLSADGKEVVGVNFAKATAGENINYVIPAWRVRQLLDKHRKDQPDMPENGQWRRLTVHVPRHELVTEEPNEALYSLYGDCGHGIFVANIGSRSFLRRAQPPLQERVFLTAVNGRELDRFGYGINAEFAADRVAFANLIFMVSDLNGDVEFETCSQGHVAKHRASLKWMPDYDSGLRYVDEPTLEGTGEAYEFFADVCVVEMTANHIDTIMQTMRDPGPMRWTTPELVAQPRLMVSFVSSGSHAADVIAPGSAVAKVNGHEVRTLAEFRQRFEPAAGHEAASDIWTVETDTGSILAVMFNQTLEEQVSKAKATQAAYMLTPGVVSAARKTGVLAGADGSPGHASPLEVVAHGFGNVDRSSLLEQGGIVGDSVARHASGPLTTYRRGVHSTSGSRNVVVTNLGILSV